MNEIGIRIEYNEIVTFIVTLMFPMKIIKAWSRAAMKKFWDFMKKALSSY